MNKNKELAEIQQTLEQIYLKNMNFFKSKFASLYDAIIQFQNLQLEHYSLDFTNNHFELTFLKDNVKQYGCDPFLDAQKRLKEFTFSNAFAMIQLKPLEKKRHYENEINAYEYLNEYITCFTETNITQEVQKFIFVGTLLGVHINDFHNQLRAKSYLIIEPDIEIFRLSMFMTDYETLAQNSSLYFCIAQSESQINSIVNQFLEEFQEYNHFIHYELGSQKNAHLIPKLSLLLTQFNEMRYPFSEYILSLQRGYHYFFNQNKPILDLSKEYTFLENKKVIFLGAGPSLGENIKWLEKNQKEFIIVASSAVLKQLELFLIKPDVIIILDAKKEQMIRQFDVSPSFYEKTIILASIKIDFDLYTILKHNPIFFMQNTLELFLGNGFFSGITVGDIGTGILLKLGVTKLYLLGIDAAINSKTGATYVGTHESSTQVDLSNNNTSSSIDFEKDILYVKGNFQEQVPTFIEYSEMIEQLNHTLQKADSKVNIYNLSDGAYFKNTHPTHTKDVKFTEAIDKATFYDEFTQALNTISKTRLSSLDSKNIQKERKILKKISAIKNDEHFYKNFLQLKRNFEYSIILSIINKYFNLINPYYNFFDSKKEANKIRQHQIAQLVEKLNTIYATVKEK
ncbi:MAG: 6-hydroxymethylpterin diphosphokinase MptE-like protein [Candidatus Marinarcus sp.]|uniref:6-hydroxymethylpterin diphosphokinase MptE-like protein n=1 Tax=Candidatus Marinarcus sp. TaxID=3100987 RepID=UPI003B00237B